MVAALPVSCSPSGGGGGGNEAHDVSILDHCTSSKVLAKFVPTEAYERL